MISKKVLTGIIFILVGGCFFYMSLSYAFGSVVAMGPGYFPMLISAMLTLVGIAIVIKDLVWKY